MTRADDDPIYGDNSAPRVSVSTVTYNHERWIGQAIESALSQDIADLEVVIADDASTDGTMAIVEQLAATDRRVRILPTPSKLGQRRNYMRTMEACRGRYINQLDGDDFFLAPHKLRVQADFLDGHPELVGCFSTAQEVDEHGRALGPPSKPRGERSRYGLGDFVALNRSYSSAMMFRRGLFDDFPDWFKRVPAGDWALHVLNAQHGDFVWLDETLAAHRVHGKGIWSSLVLRAQIERSLEERDIFMSSLSSTTVASIRDLVCEEVLGQAHDLVNNNSLEEAADVARWLRRHWRSDASGAKLLRLAARIAVRRNRIGRAVLDLRWRLRQRGLSRE